MTQGPKPGSASCVCVCVRAGFGRHKDQSLGVCVLCWGGGGGGQCHAWLQALQFQSNPPPPPQKKKKKNQWKNESSCGRWKMAHHQQEAACRNTWHAVPQEEGDGVIKSTQKKPGARAARWSGGGRHAPRLKPLRRCGYRDKMTDAETYWTRGGQILALNPANISHTSKPVDKIIALSSSANNDRRPLEGASGFQKQLRQRGWGWVVVQEWGREGSRVSGQAQSVRTAWLKKEHSPPGSERQ